MRKVFIISIIISFCFICFTGCNSKNSKVLITAHRGASGLAPENTMSAMIKAIECGSDFAELDVQETKDGQIVLLHDETLLRTANIPKGMWELNYADLKDVNVGSWFSDEFKGEPVPTLADVIDTVHGKMKLNIELKMNGHEQQLEERTLVIIEEKNFIQNCVVTSFKFSAIDKVRKLNPAIKVGYIFSKMPDDVDVFTANVDLLSVNHKLVDKAFVDKAHANGKEVHVYTVNEPNEMKHFIELGVDSIITNRPDLLAKLL
ncbi:glycerophosphodiester phosphodiesterase [candidate division KSB1 bacterium]|nr:glycerophosphodiester phosphodiesterase [candidate division KSB1 bacterium]